MGRIAGLERFMSRSVGKCQPFFHVLRRGANFTWDQEADEAFQVQKAYLAHLPKITSPLSGETLLFYLAISEQAISAILVVEKGQGTNPHLLYKPRLSRGRGELSPYRKVRLHTYDG